MLSAKGRGTGSALRALYVADALRRRGHFVRLAPLLPTWPLWLDMALSTLWYLPFALRRRYDAVWCVKPYPTLVPACWVQKCLGAQVVFDVDDLDWAYSGPLMRPLHRALQLPWPRWGAFTTYHNPLLKDILQDEFGLGARSLVRLPQGVDFSVFHPPVAGEKEPGLPLYLDPARRPHLVFTAHLNVACDLGELLRAFKLVLRRHPKATLLIAGGGPDQAHFERLTRDLGIGGDVRFTGPLKPRQVAAYLRSADAALVYYRASEANRHRASLKGREAVACGCRVVATRVGDAEEWGAHSTLSDPFPSAFAAAVDRALRVKTRPRRAPAAWGWDACVRNLERRLLEA